MTHVHEWMSNILYGVTRVWEHPSTPPTLHITSDATLHAVAGVLWKNLPDCRPISELLTPVVDLMAFDSPFSQDSNSGDINLHELWACIWFLSILIHMKLVTQGSRISWGVDNRVSVSWLRRGRPRTTNQRANVLLKFFMRLVISMQLQTEIYWIPSKSNCLADARTRQVDGRPWRITPGIFREFLLWLHLHNLPVPTLDVSPGFSPQVVHIFHMQMQQTNSLTNHFYKSFTRPSHSCLFCCAPFPQTKIWFHNSLMPCVAKHLPNTSIWMACAGGVHLQSSIASFRFNGTNCNSCAPFPQPAKKMKLVLCYFLRCSFPFLCPFKYPGPHLFHPPSSPFQQISVPAFPSSRCYWLALNQIPRGDT